MKNMKILVIGGHPADIYNFLPVGDHRLGWSKEAHTESFKRVNLMVTRQKKFLGKF